MVKSMGLRCWVRILRGSPIFTPAPRPLELTGMMEADPAEAILGLLLKN
jgi:hypothetical protein